MRKVSEITIRYEDGVELSFNRNIAMWLFIVSCSDGFKQIALSGDEKEDTFLLKILEGAIEKTIFSTNIIPK